MCCDIKQMKASSGGENLTIGFFIMLGTFSAGLYPKETSLGGKSSKEYARDSLILSSFLFLVQFDMQI